MNGKTIIHRCRRIAGILLFFFAILPVLQGNAAMQIPQHIIDVEEQVFPYVTRDVLNSIWRRLIVDDFLREKLSSYLFQDCSDALLTEFLEYTVNDVYVPAFNLVKLSKTSSLSEPVLMFGIPSFPLLKNRYDPIFVTDTLNMGVKNTDAAAFHSNDDDFTLDLLPSFEKWKKPGKFTLSVLIILIGFLLAWMTKE